MKMLIYDEWAVPGEVEYAEKIAAEIEEQIYKHRDDYNNDRYGVCNSLVYIPITEHIIGKFEFVAANYTWGIDAITDNEMILDWFQEHILSIKPKMFDIPDDDIRSSLPEWNDSLLTDGAREDIMNEHSIRRNLIRELEGAIEYGTPRYMVDKLDISEVRLKRIIEEFLKKLETANKNVGFTEMEKRITEYFRERGWLNGNRFYHRFGCLEPWHFPLEMTEDDIIDAVREAYTNASKRSKRILPSKADAINMFNVWTGYECRFIENYQCLYQGRAGNLIIRFLFNFKDMKIVNAYPVLNKK